jgi:hypothetical protein
MAPFRNGGLYSFSQDAKNATPVRHKIETNRNHMKAEDQMVFGGLMYTRFEDFSHMFMRPADRTSIQAR